MHVPGVGCEAIARQSVSGGRGRSRGIGSSVGCMVNMLSSFAGDGTTGSVLHSVRDVDSGDEHLGGCQGLIKTWRGSYLGWEMVGYVREHMKIRLAFEDNNQ